MNTARAYELCGTNENTIKRREKTEEGKFGQRGLKVLTQIVLEDIKRTTYKKDKWIKVSFEFLMQNNGVKQRMGGEKVKATYRGLLMQALQEHPHIVSRPATKSNSKSGIIAHTVPLEYRYVDEEEKIEMAADAICFRQIQGANKKRIVNALNKMDTPMRSNWAVTFAVAEYLITRGAFKAWLYTRPLEIAAMTGVRVKEVINSLLDLYDAGILVIRDFDAPLEGETARIKSICHLTKNEQEYSQLMKKPLSEIENIGVEKVRRAPRKVQDTIEKANAVLAQIKDQGLLDEPELRAKTPKRELVKDPIPVIKRPEGFLRDKNFEEIMASILKQGMEAINENVGKQIENKTKELKNQVAEKNNKLSQQSIEVADLRDKIRQLESELKRSKEIQKKLVEFNDGVIAAAQDANFTLMGSVGKLVRAYAEKAVKDRTFLTDESKIDNLTGRIVKATEVISENMLEYKKDYFPPVEKA